MTNIIVNYYWTMTAGVTIIAANIYIYIFYRLLLYSLNDINKF